MTKKTILIIGSNSFSGSHFINLLLKKNYRVIGLSRSNELNNVYLPYKSSKYLKNFFFYKTDLNKSLKKIIKIIQKYKPSYVVNFSAQGMVAESWLKPEDWYRTNILSQVKLLNYLNSFKFIKRYLHVTTPEVYGSHKSWKKESNTFNPNTPYAISRAALDMHLQALNKVYNFPVIFTRTSNVYGPSQQLYRIIPKAIMVSLLNKKILLHGDGLSVRSFIYITDACQANYKILLKGKIGHTYHISTNSILSFKNLVFKISKLTKHNFDKFVKKANERKGKDHSYKLNSDKLRKKLLWKDQISLDQGLKLTFKWIKENFNFLKKQSLEYKHKI